MLQSYPKDLDNEKEWSACIKLQRNSGDCRDAMSKTLSVTISSSTILCIDLYFSLLTSNRSLVKYSQPCNQIRNTAFNIIYLAFSLYLPKLVHKCSVVLMFFESALQTRSRRLLF